jgi:hypothetical protein
MGSSLVTIGPCIGWFIRDFPVYIATDSSLPVWRPQFAIRNAKMAGDSSPGWTL